MNAVVILTDVGLRFWCSATSSTVAGCVNSGALTTETETTPAHDYWKTEMDYVPAKAPVLMGHHFSSIAGAGPITRTDSVQQFSDGCRLCPLGSESEVFSSVAVHDFGALFASVRNKGHVHRRGYR